MMIYDMRNNKIIVGACIAYGKSSRYRPISIGEVIEITEDDIYILGKGNSKVGKIPLSHLKRIIVLPDNYMYNEGDI